jgi:hypothetical protein
MITPIHHYIIDLIEFPLHSSDLLSHVYKDAELDREVHLEEEEEAMDTVTGEAFSKKE